MDYIIALIPALAWGLIGIIAAKMGGDSSKKTLGSMVGFILFATVIYITRRPTITIQIAIVGAISGSMLAMANFGQFDGMDEIGVSRTVPLVAAGQLTMNTLVAAILFKEWINLKQWVIGLIALAIIILGSKMTSFQEDTKNNSNTSLYTKKGLTGIAICIVAGSLYSIVPKAYQYFYTGIIPADYIYGLMLPQAIGGFLSANIIYMIREKKNPISEYKSKYLWKNSLTGLSWSIGNLFLLISSTGRLGLATAFTLSQLNLVVGGIAGTVILKEDKTKIEMKYFLLGILLVIIGAVMTSSV